MLPVLPTAVLLLIIAKLAWSDQAALSLTSRDTYQSLRPFVCAHTSRLRSMLRNWTSRSLPPASQAVSWPVALQSARCMDTDEAVPSFIIAVAPLLTVHMGHLYTPDQLAGQLALKVHRALQKCPFMRNIYIQAFASVVKSGKLAPFFQAVHLSARDDMVEFRHCFEQHLSHLYRQQALHVIARPALRHMQDDFDLRLHFQSNCIAI